METLQNIKHIIYETLSGMGVSLKEIILFGSKAKQTDNRLSDCDFLIITDESFNQYEKMKIAKTLRVRLQVYAVDIIIKSEDEFHRQKNNFGSIAREVMKTGIVL